jgi:hypothetical protein
MDVRRFGQAVGRRFERFPFPDDVTPWLRPLEALIQNKHERNSAEGVVLRDIAELRIEAAEAWAVEPYSLTLCVIVKDGVIPNFDEEAGDLACSPTVQEWLRDDQDKLQQNWSSIAQKLVSVRTESPSSTDVYFLWLALVEAWGILCEPDLKKCNQEDLDRIRSAVAGIDAELFDERTFTLYRYRRSERLDLDHLSSPRPV